MKSLGKIIFYLLATVILGALLAPPLYWGGHWLADHGILTWLGETPFRKFFHRGLLIAAIVLLWPTARWLQVPGLHALGINPNPRRWEDALVGFAASFLMMVALAAVLLGLEVVRLRQHVHGLDLVKIATSAVVVSILEEWLFRGAILGLLARSMHRNGALFLTSALFSILHFLKPNDNAVPQTVNWLSGFGLIPGSFAQFSQPWLVLGGFTTLFCMAWILGYSRFKTGSLWMAIGLHTGWVFGLMSFNKITKRLIKDTLPWFGENLAVGFASVIVVLLTGLLLWAWFTYVRPDSKNHPQRG